MELNSKAHNGMESKIPIPSESKRLFSTENGEVIKVTAFANSEPLQNAVYLSN